MNERIGHGSTVLLQYTVRDEAGTVLDSNEGSPPLTYVHGQRQIIPGLETALAGRRAGDTLQVTVPCEDAYGPPDPTAVAEVPREKIPEEGQVPGTELTARRRDGGTQHVRVKEVRDETIVLDLNHPLAGKTLHLDVRVLEVTSPGAS